MKRLFVLLLIVLSNGFCAVAQDTLSLVFVGDVMQHRKQLEAAHLGKGLYAYDSCFSYVEKYIASADIAIANLETTLAGAPYSGYPAFCSPDELASALKRCGFDILLTANNHSCDKGKRGVERTLKVLDSLNLTHTGTFYTRQHRDTAYPLIIEKNNFRLALLNYTYGTNGIAVPEPTIVNLIDTVQIAADIIRAKESNPDIIIANIHWGEEYKLAPSQEQTNLAKFFFDNDVRMVIGSHPHVLQRMEKKEDKQGYFTSNVVIYSLGNFVSNMLTGNTEIGVIAGIRLIKTGADVAIDQCNYRLTWVYKPVENKKTQFYILPIADYENNPAFFTAPGSYQRMKKSAEAMRHLFQKENSCFTEQK